MKIKSKPYELLGLCAILVFAISLLPTSNAVDFNSHDTYLVISMHHVYWLIAAIFLFIWLLYFCFSSVLLSKKLTWANVILTIFPVMILLVALFARTSLDGVPRRYYSFTEFQNMKPWYKKEVLYSGILATIVVGQLIFIVNLLGGIIKRISKPAPTL